MAPLFCPFINLVWAFNLDSIKFFTSGFRSGCTYYEMRAGCRVSLTLTLRAIMPESIKIVIIQ